MIDKARLRRRGVPIFAAAICFVSGGALLTTDLLAEPQSDQRVQLDEKKAEKSPVQEQDLKHAFALSNAFKQVVQAIGPSVVNIRVVQEIQAPPQGTPQNPFGDQFRSPFDEEFFRRFFGEEAPDPFDFRMPQMPRELQGQGSGVIVREDGYILTNNHVVANATRITVVLSDDREFQAEVVGADPEMDLVVLKIDAETLPAAPFGDSDAMEVGEWVVAIGSPFGLDQTVTAGIVSAKGRNNMNLATFENFIQTDAAINPGNSGGPLVNLYGELVGINTAISTRTGGYMGVGFAIPSNAAEGVFQSIVETGSVKRGWLGVAMQPLEDAARESFQYEGAGGVLVAQVLEDTPAAEAGLRPGDIVTKVEGRRIKDQTELLNAIAERAPGESIELEVFRNGETRNFDVTLGERDPAVAVGSRRGGDPRGNGRSEDQARLPEELGLTVLPLTGQMAEQLNATDVEGVVVRSVRQGSLAAEAGVAPGDIITAVGSEQVESVDEFVEVMEGADLSNVVRLQIRRQGTQLFLFLKNGEEGDD